MANGLGTAISTGPLRALATAGSGDDDDDDVAVHDSVYLDWAFKLRESISNDWELVQLLDSCVASIFPDHHHHHHHRRHQLGAGGLDRGGQIVTNRRTMCTCRLLVSYVPIESFDVVIRRHVCFCVEH